jgi:hydroxyacid-oxoacid transhydrogenase
LTVRVAPTDESFLDGAKVRTGGWLRWLIGLGGGSTIDTAKAAANLYSVYPPNDFLDYVNPPLRRP